MWQSFAAIGRGTSEIGRWTKKNITGETQARPERWFFSYAQGNMAK